MTAYTLLLFYISVISTSLCVTVKYKVILYLDMSYRCLRAVLCSVCTRVCARLFVERLECEEWWNLTLREDPRLLLN